MQAKDLVFCVAEERNQFQMYKSANADSKVSEVWKHLALSTQQPQTAVMNKKQIFMILIRMTHTLFQSE